MGNQAEGRPLFEMIGRRSDLVALARLVTDPDVRLVTLSGTGGIGKTRLAQELICTVAGDFADGATFIDLVPVSDARLLPERVAAMIGAPSIENRGIAESVITHLADQNRLLILDNMEQLLQGVPFVQDLLVQCADLVILATSRQRLAIPGERVFELTPLDLPAQQGIVSLETIEQSDAIQLFMKRAQAVDRTFRLTADNALDIAAICRRLDGLPLAIELAASRVTEIPPHLILRNFVRILPFLERSEHDPDGRHRTMRNAITWSFESLSPEERALFARLSVFQSGFTLEGALAVGSVATPEPASLDPEITMLRRLASLVSKHLLIRRGWNGSDPRFDMLQTMREYGLEQLSQTGEERAARDAHAAYLIALAERLKSRLLGAEPGEAIASYTAELDEFRAALTWLTTSRPVGDLDALRLCNALARFWLWGGHTGEGVRWYRLVIEHLPKNDSPELATAYLNIGHFTNDDLSSAFDAYQMSLDMYRRLNDLVSVAGLLSCLGMTSENLGDFKAAEGYLHESLRIFESLENDQGVAHDSHLLGTLAGSRGDFDQATRYLDRARTLSDQQGDTTNAIFSTIEMGKLFRIAGRFRDADVLLRWSLSRLDEKGIEHTRGIIHSELGMIALATNDPATALTEFRAAVQQAIDTSALNFLVVAITGMSELATMSGKYEEAADLLSGLDRWVEASGHTRDSGVKALMEETIRRIKSAIGKQAHDAAWARGSLLSINDLARLAMSLDIDIVRFPAIAQTTGKKASPYQLTKQERVVLCRLAQGDKNQQIADALFISNRTVAVHVQNILRKLDVENRTQASAVAHTEHLCDYETDRHHD